MVGAIIGGVAALVGALIAGGTNLAVGVAAGLVVGAVGGYASAFATDRRRRAVHAVGSVTPRNEFPALAPAALTPPAPLDPSPPSGRAGSNLGSIVTSIGHRYQELADRQLESLTKLAGDELDAPVVAKELAQSTRLARKIRRASKTLQVLADDPTSPETAPPARIRDVIELAIADNDHQARIDYDSLHAATVSGAAVPDLVHLLAELIDNAIAATSGTDTKVLVLGRKSTDSYLLSVVDEGAGIDSPERAAANATLQAAPALAVQAADTFGLSTASRLAARHEIGVTLLEAATDGIIAKVRVPAKLLEGQSGGAANNGNRRDEQQASNRKSQRRQTTDRNTDGNTGRGAGTGADDTVGEVIDLTDAKRAGDKAGPAATTKSDA